MNTEHTRQTSYFHLFYYTITQVNIVQVPLLPLIYLNNLLKLVTKNLVKLEIRKLDFCLLVSIQRSLV